MVVFNAPPEELSAKLPEGFRLSGPRGTWKEYVVHRNDEVLGHIVRMGKGWQCHSAFLKPWKNPVGWKTGLDEAVILLGEAKDGVQPPN